MIFPQINMAKLHWRKILKISFAGAGRYQTLMQNCYYIFMNRQIASQGFFMDERGYYLSLINEACKKGNERREEQLEEILKMMDKFK